MPSRGILEHRQRTDGKRITVIDLSAGKVPELLGGTPEGNSRKAKSKAGEGQSGKASTRKAVSRASGGISKRHRIRYGHSERIEGHSRREES